MKTKTKVLLVILAIILLAGGFIGGQYFAGNDIFHLFKDKKEENKIKKEEKPKVEENSENVVLTDVTVKELYSRVDVFNVYDVGQPYDGYVYKIKDKLDVQNMDNKVKLYMGMMYLNKKPFWDPAQGKVEIKASDFDTAIKTVFGNNITYTNESLSQQNADGTYGSCGYVQTAFNSQSQTYTQTIPQCGPSGFGYPYYFSKLVSAVKYEDRLELTEGVIYVDDIVSSTEDNKTCNVYTNIDKATVVASNQDYRAVLATQQAEEPDEYTNKSDKYKYIFKLENGLYYLKTIEKVAK